MAKFEIDGTTFLVDMSPGRERQRSSSDFFVLVKTDRMLDFYRGLANKRPRDIMEVGMFEGGSLVYFDKLFKPRCLVGLDARKEPIEPLEAYAANRPHIKTYYARYQDKPGTLMAAKENFPEGIDLVVDDASHHYELSKATFTMLFPLVREGGTYVIEDWSWAHREAYQKPDAPWRHMPALSNLIIELVVASTFVPQIESIYVDRALVAVTRGPGPFTAESLDLSKNLRGRTLSSL
ncbi:MAG TPA: class I SAM-dependent methyltransferase [Alphaproteobacteria bacterium]|nr:class I SAM-dependent methyltransferase [Alphaproteobacteria bacterium]